MSVQVIAECCQNHNGDFSILKEMVHQAAEAGATHAKIQTIFAEDVAMRERFEEGLVENGVTRVIKRPYKPEYDRLKGLELSFEQQAEFIALCEKYKVIPLTTCFTRGSVKRIAALPWRVIKVASYDCGSLPMIRELANKFDHLIISTGASYNDEIEETAKYLNDHKKKFSFLHCVTIYPTPMSELHLRRMSWLKKFTPGVGLSSHTLTERDGIKADMAAIYLGASIVERHYTILKPAESRDGPVSINPKQLAQIVAFSKLPRSEQEAVLKKEVPEFEAMLGMEQRDLSPAELLNRDYYRGRFATHTKQGVVYNWEDKEIA